MTDTDTSAEVTALVEAARREEREAAAQWHDTKADEFGKGAPAIAAWHLQCAAAIRARGDA